MVEIKNVFYKRLQEKFSPRIDQETFKLFKILKLRKTSSSFHLLSKLFTGNLASKDVNIYLLRNIKKNSNLNLSKLYNVNVARREFI